MGKIFQNLSCLIILISIQITYGQVGINTTEPEGILDITSTTQGLIPPRIALTAANIAAPVTNPKTGVTALVEGTIVYNTVTNGSGGNIVIPGLYVWRDSRWNRFDQELPVSSSISLTTDETLSGASFTLVPGMTHTFTAQKTSVLVMLSASGFGDPGDPMSFIELRVLNGTISLGGTQTNIHSTSRSGGPSSFEVITTWSANFSKLLSGLTIGNTYTLSVEARLDGTASTNQTSINPVTDSDASHLTLSVIQ